MLQPQSLPHFRLQDWSQSPIYFRNNHILQLPPSSDQAYHCFILFSIKAQLEHKRKDLSELGKRNPPVAYWQWQAMQITLRQIKITSQQEALSDGVLLGIPIEV